MGRVPVQVFKNPRVRDDPPPPPLCVSAPPGGVSARATVRTTLRPSDDGLADVSGLFRVYSARGPSPSGATPRRWRRRERGCRHFDVRPRARPSRRRASSPIPRYRPRTSTESATSVPRKPRRRSLKASRRRVSSDRTSCGGRRERGNRDARRAPARGRRVGVPTTPRRVFRDRFEMMSGERSNAKDELHHRVASVPRPRPRRGLPPGDGGEGHLRLVPGAVRTPPHPATA